MIYNRSFNGVVLIVGLLKAVLKRIKIRLQKGEELIKFYGPYETWKEAQEASCGYGDHNILSKTLEAARLVKAGVAAYERDSVVFFRNSKPVILCNVLSGLSKMHGSISVIDFGGGLGSLYYKTIPWLPRDMQIDWRIVEQQGLVEVGSREFSDSSLTFIDSSQVKVVENAPDLLILSNALQYLEEPLAELASLLTTHPLMVLIDLVAMSNDNTSAILVQRIYPPLYSASYPMHVFGREELFRVLTKNYRCILEVPSLQFPALEKKMKASLKTLLFERVDSGHD